MTIRSTRKKSGPSSASLLPISLGVLVGWNFRRFFVVRRLVRAADDHRDQALVILLVGLGLSHDVALAEDYGPVSHLHDVFEVVGDHDHGDPVAWGVLDQAQNVARFAGAQGRGRLVEDHDLASEGHRTGAGHRLPLAAAHKARLHVGPWEVYLQAAHEFVSLAGHVLVLDPAPVPEPAWCRRLPSSVEVAYDVEVVEEGEVLVDSLDAEGASLHWRGDVGLFAIDEDLSLIGLVDAAEAFDQGRFSRPVVAEEREYFVTSQGEAHAVQCQGRPEPLGKVPYLEDGPPVLLPWLLCVLGLHVSCLPGLECTEALLEPAPEHVELDRNDNDHARRHELVVDVDVQEVQAVLDNADDERADDHIDDRPSTSEEARAADDHGGDGGKLFEFARGREACVGPARREHPGEPCHKTANDEDGDKDSVHGYTLPACCFLVAAYGVDPTSPLQAPRHDNRESGQHCDHDDGHRDGPDVPAAEEDYDRGHAGDGTAVRDHERETPCCVQHGEGRYKGMGHLTLHVEESVDPTAHHTGKEYDQKC